MILGELAELATYQPAPNGVAETKVKLKLLSDKVDEFQSLSQLYIRKVQKVQIVIGQVQATENIISRLEEKINQQLAQQADTADALEMKLRLLKNSSFEIGAQDALMQTLTEAAKEAKGLGTQVADQSQRTDPDDYIYCITVQRLQDRLDALKNRLKVEMEQIEGEIPILKAQEVASERAMRTLQDSERLIKELELIRQNGEKEIRREHPEQFDVRSSLSRCDDLEKRLAGIKSPISIALNEIDSQLADSGLTDGNLRDRLESAGGRLKSSKDAADNTVQGIQSKMSDLTSAMDALAATAAILQRYHSTLDQSNICTTIDDYEHRAAMLQELIDEIPVNDPKFQNLKNHLVGLPENDLDRSRLTGICNDQNTEWNQLKWQLNMAMEANRKELERKQKEREKADQMESLRLDISAFIERLNRISSEQCAILGLQHTMEVKTFYDALQGQQKILDLFNKTIEPEYKNFVSKCRQYQMSAEEAELKTSWERVWFLTKNLIDKLKAGRTFGERIDAANQVIAKWTIEAERFERESNSLDIEFLSSLAKDAQRAYAATQEDDQTIFVLPQFASQIATAHAPVAREARDEDGIAANALSDELLKQWQNLKQRIQVAGKTAAQNAKQRQIEQQSSDAANEAMAANQLMAKLKSLEARVKARLNTPTPLELSDLDHFVFENESITTEIRTVKTEVDQFSNRTMEFLRKSRELAPEMQNSLRSEMEGINDTWNQIDAVWSVYSDKIRRVKNCAEKYQIARRQLENCEDSLVRIEIVSQTVEERDLKIEQLRSLQSQFPQIEPLFFALESSHSECKGAEHRLSQKGYHDQGNLTNQKFSVTFGLET